LENDFVEQKEMNKKLKMENNNLLDSMQDLKQKFGNVIVEVSHLKDQDVFNKNLTNELIEDNVLIQNKLFKALKENEDISLLVASLKQQLQKCEENKFFENNEHLQLIEQIIIENNSFTQQCKILNIDKIVLKKDNEILKQQLCMKLDVIFNSKETQCFLQDENYFIILI